MKNINNKKRAPNCYSSMKRKLRNILAGSVLVQNCFYEVKSGQIFAKFHIFTQTF